MSSIAQVTDSVKQEVFNKNRPIIINCSSCGVWHWSTSSCEDISNYHSL